MMLSDFCPLGRCDVGKLIYAGGHNMDRSTAGRSIRLFELKNVTHSLVSNIKLFAQVELVGPNG
jgi:hypothetical protein